MTRLTRTEAAALAVLANAGVASLPFTFAALPGGPVKEAMHTLGAEVACWAGERSMRPRGRSRWGAHNPRSPCRAPLGGRQNRDEKGR